MEPIIVLLSSVLGGLWRRWHGMGQGPRIVRLAVSFVLAAAPWVVFNGWAWWPAYLIAAAVTAYWIPGHKMMEWGLGRWLLRYGPPGVFWWAAQKAHKNDPHAFRWGKFIDGPFAIAEILTGVFVFGVNAAVAAVL